MNESKDKPSNGFHVPKVMDVNRPGRNHSIIGASRPVVSSPVTGTAHDSMVNSTDNNTVKDSESSTHKLVISPISEDLSTTSSVSSDEGSEDAALDSPGQDKLSKESESEAGRSSVDFADEGTGSAEDSVSDASGVDMLAANAAEKRQAKQQSEDEANRKAEVEELIASKEYYVKLADTKTQRLKVVIVIVTTVALIGVVVAAAYIANYR